ncbi:hypothetical protein HCK70_002171 [Salmonella enterica]|nr:hypothetical protein [Salmonella enterica]
MNVIKIECKKEDYRKSMKDLNRIFFAIQLSISRRPVPKTMFAVWIALASALCCFLVWKFLNPEIEYFNIFTSAIFVSLVYLIAYKFNSYSDSWERVIDALLVKYEPLDRDSYLDLQNHTKDYGIDTDYLLCWISKERELILKRLGKKRNIDFIKRKI